MENSIKNILKEKGIAQKELAEKIGMSEIGLSKAINGSATLSTLQKIAQALDVPLGTISPKMRTAKYGSDKTPLLLGNLSLPCYVLDDGTRVFSGRGIQKAIGAGGSQSGTWLSTFVNSSAMAAYIDPGLLDRLNNPIPFIRAGAGGSQSMTYGYEATLLIDLCNAILSAGEYGAADKSLIEHANIIIRSVAKVGIIALIDEVTGYDKAKEKAKDELQKFLNQFMSEEAAKWVKTFDDTFFEDLYKMHNWTWTKTNQRPGVVGLWINDIVYKRIAPLIYNELQRVNPKNENGHRSYKHHQFLTEEIGKPRLQRHLEAVHALAVASHYNWSRFMDMLDTVYPTPNQQLPIDFGWEE